MQYPTGMRETPGGQALPSVAGAFPFQEVLHLRDEEQRILNQIGGSLVAFMQDLRNMKKADKVVIMTYSEFGRRVKENGSRALLLLPSPPRFPTPSPSRSAFGGICTSPSKRGSTPQF